MANEVKIPVSLPGAAQASSDAKKVADGLEKVNVATKEQAKHSKEAAKNLNEFGEASEKGAAVGRLLKEVTEGNVGALGQLGAVLKASGAAVKTSVFGVVLIAATALLSFLPSLIAKLRGSKDELEGVAKEGDAVAEAFAKIAKARNEAFSAQLTSIQQQAKGAADELERIVRLQNLINQAKGGDVGEARRIDDMRVGALYSNAVDARDRAASAVTGAQGDVSALEGSVAADQAARQRRRALELELQGLQRRPGGTSDEARARGARMDEISAELKGTASINSPETMRFAVEQTKQIAQAREVLARATKAAADAEQALAAVARDNGVVGIGTDGRAIREPSIMIARGLEDRRRREAAGVSEPASQTGSISTVTGGGISIRGANGEELSNKISEKISEQQREFADLLAAAMARRAAEDRRYFDEKLKSVVPR